MRKYKHTEHYVENIINNANLTRVDVVSRFEQKGMKKYAYTYYDAINYLRQCDIDNIRWILFGGKYPY